MSLTWPTAFQCSVADQLCATEIRCAFETALQLFHSAVPESPCLSIVSLLQFVFFFFIIAQL